MKVYCLPCMKKTKQIAKDNQYILDFLQHVSKFSENDLDDRIIELVKQMIQ